MADRKYRIPILSIAGLLIGVAFVLFYKPEVHVDNKRIQDSLRSKELEYKTKLENSEKERRALRLERDSLLDIHRDHLRIDSLRDAELKSVPGKFNNLNSQQLEAKMLDEYNKSH